jgi:hypothetical protein
MTTKKKKKLTLFAKLTRILATSAFFQDMTQIIYIFFFFLKLIRKYGLSSDYFMNFKNNFMFKSNGSTNQDSTHSKFTRKYQLPISAIQHHQSLGLPGNCVNNGQQQYQTKDNAFFVKASSFNNNYGKLTRILNKNV